MAARGQSSAMARALDPVSRATEILFGLIMVLTFTASLNTAEAGHADVRLMLIGALGCNLAWGLIDAAMYLLSARAEKALALRTIHRVRQAQTPAEADDEIAATLPPLVARALRPGDLIHVRQQLMSLDPPRMPTGPAVADLLAAGMIFLLVFVATLPVVVPFLLIGDARQALWLSHGVAIASLFLAGHSLGRLWDRPWRVGLAMVAVGIALVGIALALGG
ncbi:hypothetical protein [Paracoccus sp. KR1-242]|uniref:hypothetical protein n=1 Tax=Paracoccus sp. KR1-242 TaxID=3410028 RepID=UPI003C0DEB46